MTMSGSKASRRLTIGPILGLSAIGLTLGGCATATPIPDTAERPYVRALKNKSGESMRQIGVGETLKFVGEGFVPPEEGWVDITFKGEFQASNQVIYPIQSFDDEGNEIDKLTIALQANPEGTEITWERFGEYRVPFGPGDFVGTFTGNVCATNRYFRDAEIQEAQPAETCLTTELGVKPSLVVLDFRAMEIDGWYAGLQGSPRLPRFTGYLISCGCGCSAPTRPRSRLPYRRVYCALVVSKMKSKLSSRTPIQTLSKTSQRSNKDSVISTMRFGCALLRFQSRWKRIRCT